MGEYISLVERGKSPARIERDPRKKSICYHDSKHWKMENIAI